MHIINPRCTRQTMRQITRKITNFLLTKFVPDGLCIYKIAIGTIDSGGGGGGVEERVGRYCFFVLPVWLLPGLVLSPHSFALSSRSKIASAQHLPLLLRQQPRVKSSKKQINCLALENPARTTFAEEVE